MQGLIILEAFLWVVLAIWPAYLAKKKGYSFVIFLIMSWAISWLLALLLVLILDDKNRPSAKSETT